MWQKETALLGTRTWQNALKYCEGLALAGHTDWRLPNVRELLSIVDYGRYDPSIDPIFGAVSNVYCSSSTFVYWPRLVRELRLRQCGRPREDRQPLCPCRA